MASLSQNSSGGWVIQFQGADRRRRTLRVGKMPRKSAETVRRHTEELVSSSITGEPPSDETSRWLARTEDWLRDRIAAVGLATRREVATLGKFVDQFIATREGTVKRSTTWLFTHTRRNLVAHFGEHKTLRSFTPADGDEFRSSLVASGLAEATVARRVKCARQIFRTAVRKKILDANPFADVETGSTANPSKLRFVTADETARLLEACPDVRWRTIIALARFGGLRTPSETALLRWTDIDWHAGRITITSPKTEHHSGGGSRIVPLFPELREILDDAYAVAPDGSEFVVDGLRNAATNLRTQFSRIVQRAGLTPWPRPLQNLRSSRETELSGQFPLHVVCAWIGNSEPVARKHYLQVTNDHFREALEPARCKALQNPTQQTPDAARRATAGGGSESAGFTGENGEKALISRANRGGSENREKREKCAREEANTPKISAENVGVSEPALQNPTYSGSKKPLLASQFTASGPVSGRPVTGADPRLLVVVDSWRFLPDAARSQIMAIVSAHSPSRGIVVSPNPSLTIEGTSP